MSIPADSQSNINLEQQRKRAKDLRRAHREGNLEAAIRVARHLPRARNLSAAEVLTLAFTLSEAQFVVAREAGFPSWPLLKRAIEKALLGEAQNGEALIDAAFAGNDDAVKTALERDPGAARHSIYVAAALGDTEAMFVQLDDDPSLADRRGGRREWTPLLYLCCSRYRRQEPDMTAARVRIARRLIELGADVNATGREPGFTNQDQEWHPVDGAVGPVASPELVRLLVFAGAAIGKTHAVLSHAVRGGDIEVLRLLLESAPEDWYQVIWALRECVVLDRRDMARLLVAHAARPQGNDGLTAAQHALQEAIRLERDPELIDILLGDDDKSELSRPVRRKVYRSAVRYGHRTAVELLRRRGSDDAAVTPVDRVIGACVTGDREALHRLLKESPYSKTALRASDHRMLAWAIRRGHHSAIPLLLEAGLDPNVPDNDGETPLHLAVRAASLELVDTLLRTGAHVDTRNFEAETPLEIALAETNAETRGRLTRRLLDAGAKPAGMSQFTPRKYGPSVEDSGTEREDPDLLFERAADAVAFGDLEALRKLLDEHPALVHARSPRPHRCTLLNYCGANGTEDPRQRTPSNAAAIAQLLLERGADANATCKLYGGGATTMGLLLTSIHPKAAGVDGELIRVLSRFGVRLDTGELTCAIDSGASLAVSAMVEAGVPVDNLFVAAGLDRVDVMEDILSRGADINARYSDWYSTALHAAAGMGHKRAVTFLLDRGADASLLNSWEAAPADTARYFDHPDVAELIEKRFGQFSAEPTVKQSSGASTDPVSGSWGAEGATFLELAFDGTSAVSGTLILRAGPQQEVRAAIKTGTFDPDTGNMKLEGEAQGQNGAILEFVIEGKLDNEAFRGSFAIGEETGSFKFTRR